MKICLSLEDDDKTYGKNFKPTHAVTMTSQPKNEILQSSFYFKSTCLIMMKNCICLEDDDKTYGKKIQVDPWSNYDVTTKKRNITIQLLFQNYLLDSDENLYTSFRRLQDLW